MAKTFSGKVLIKILCREFGFYFISQRGSHAKLRRETIDRVITTIIPLHRELSSGTVKGILELAEIDEVIFWKIVKK